VSFLAARHLVEHIVANGLHEEIAARLCSNCDEPRRGQEEQPEKTWDRTQRPQPLQRAVDSAQYRGRKTDEHQYQRAFEQHAGGNRGPQDRRLQPSDFDLCFGLAREINARQRPHRRDRGQQQHGIRLGEPGFHAEQDRARHHQGGEKRGPAGNKGKRRPIGQKNGKRRAGKRGQSIDPDAVARLRHTKRLARFHRGRLQPVDSDRFLVSDLGLKPNVDIVIRFQHLFCGLRKARLVAIDRRNLEKAR
jgi:hypothetical protein